MFESFHPGGNVLVQGASRGIGLELVRQCLAEPRVGRVVAACRTPATARELTQLQASEPDRLLVIRLDLADEPTVGRAALETTKALSRLHLVANCSGVLHDPARNITPEKRLADVSTAALSQAFAVNAIGPLLVARHFEPLLSHNDRAVFASLSARVGSIEDNRLGGWYAYRASKAAQNQLMRTLAIEWARSRRNVVVASLHPGTTDTDLSKPFQANVPPGKLFDVTRAARQLLAVIDRLRPSDTGQFFGWDGERIPW
jgi:NAD(P)-dependent dehydrogenase (short-subunit alcohol dehydrogenase family)